jgi:hypothetical protein
MNGDKLEKAYLHYVEQPETPKTGECQRVDGRGWEDSKSTSFVTASLYVDTVSGINCTKYEEYEDD